LHTLGRPPAPSEGDPAFLGCLEAACTALNERLHGLYSYRRTDFEKLLRRFGTPATDTSPEDRESFPSVFSLPLILNYNKVLQERNKQPRIFKREDLKWEVSCGS